MPLTISELHTEFAAEVIGADLSDLDSIDFDAIDHQINQYSLLLLRRQNLNAHTLLAFSRLFGPLEEEHVGYYSHGSIDYVGYVGNVDKNGNVLVNNNRTVRSQTGNQMWHSDSSFREIPTLHSVLFAKEVPDEGGDTEFVSGRAAYSRLSQSRKEQITGLVGIHDYIYSRTKVSEDAVSVGQRRFMRPVRQRLVRTNAMTGLNNLFLGSHLKEIEGLEKKQSDALIAELSVDTTRPESIYRHQWQQGDVLLWDNRCVLHRGCGYDADRFRRCLIQTRVRGSCPSLAEPFES